MLRTTIYTEDTGRNVITQILNQYFSGYTLVECTGYWKGTTELALMIILIHESQDLDNVRKAIHEIKFFNEQESVMSITEEVTLFEDRGIYE